LVTVIARWAITEKESGGLPPKGSRWAITEKTPGALPPKSRASGRGASIGARCRGNWLDASTRLRLAMVVKNTYKPIIFELQLYLLQCTISSESCMTPTIASPGEIHVFKIHSRRQ
jgi:hypothetical protein